jgi:BCD family chlorophyll transporter-like MFS transporter
MWFFMIVGIIFTAAGLSHLLEVYSPAALRSSFSIIAAIALVLGLIGIIKLEPRSSQPTAQTADEERTAWMQLIKQVLGTPQARRFFIYLTVLLAAILGQDVLLEPFGAEAFGLSVQATTRITSIWGTCVLAALIIAGYLDRWLSKKKVAQISAWIAMGGFILISISGLMGNKSVFYSGVLLLGLGTGASTVSNLSLMFDMTTTQVGLFMGAWGVANALSRFLGTMMGGVVRDLSTNWMNNAVYGYTTVFVLETIMLVISLFLLRNINVSKFKEQVNQLTLSEKAALLNESAA